MFDRPAVGASGAIFGLLGSILGYALRRGTFSWQNPLIRQLLILLALNVYLGVSIDNISNTAHMGGLAGGFVFGWLMAPTVYSQKKLRALTPVFIVLGAELVLLGGLVLSIAARSGQPTALFRKRRRAYGSGRLRLESERRWPWRRG